MITKRNHKSENGKKWVSFRTKMNLLVKGEEEKGKQVKWVDVKVYDKAYPDDALSRGIITAYVRDINYPKVYEITEDENGKTTYPVVKIFAIQNFTPVELEYENPFVCDEHETEETEIDNPEEFFNEIEQASQNEEEPEIDLPDEKLPF